MTEPIEELRAKLHEINRTGVGMTAYTDALCDYLATAVPMWPKPAPAPVCDFNHGPPHCRDPDCWRKPTRDFPKGHAYHQFAGGRLVVPAPSDLAQDSPTAEELAQKLAERDRQLVDVLRERDAAILVRNMALAALRSIKASLDRELPELEGMLKR